MENKEYTDVTKRYTESAAKRVFKFARKLADIYDDKNGGYPYQDFTTRLQHMMSVTDGLVTAIKDYDEILEFLAAGEEKNDEK